MSDKTKKVSQKSADYQDVIDKRQKLSEVFASLAVYLDMQDISPRARSQIAVLQDRLEYRTLQYESQLLDEKIDIYSQALEIAKKGKKNVKETLQA